MWPKNIALQNIVFVLMTEKSHNIPDILSDAK